MNILHTVFSFNNGGIENLLIDILNNWNYRNDKVILCIINDDYDNELLSKIKSNKNLEVITLNRKKSSKSIKPLIKYIKLIYKNKIDLIHCHLFQAVKVSILAKLIRPKTKILYTVHDTNIYNNFNKLDIYIQKVFVEKIIAISNSVKEQIICFNKTNDIEVIYNAIDMKKFYTKKTKSNEIRIGCVARLIPNKKGQDILINAMKIVSQQYPDAKCYFAGTTERDKEYNMKVLMDMANELKINKNIIFLGNVNDVPAFLSTLDIFVLPSRYEGFGIVILEAMASKVPVIASRLQGPKEIIKEDKYGEMFEVEDYNSLANIIMKNIKLDNTEKINKAYEYVKNEFDVSVINNRLNHVYLESCKII